MKKLVLTLSAAVLMAVGCSDAAQVADEREDVREAQEALAAEKTEMVNEVGGEYAEGRNEIGGEVAEANDEIAGEMREGREEIADAADELAEERGELAEAKGELAEERAEDAAENRTVAKPVIDPDADEDDVVEVDID